jgi:DnaJ-domain-containing protein 1
MLGDTVTDTEALFKAKQALNKFLEENPKAKDMQAKIEAELKKCGNNQHNRMAAIKTMMILSVRELQSKFAEIKNLAQDVIKPT